MNFKSLRYALARVADRVASAGKRNAVFIWIPKTAGTSVFDALAKEGCRKFKKLDAAAGKFCQKGLVTFGHMNYAELVRRQVVSTDFDNSAFKFCFVRDPFARAVSLFFYSHKIGAVGRGVRFVDCLKRLREIGCPPVGLYNREGMSQWNPQTAWLENIDMDFVGKVETIDSDFAELQRKLGLCSPSLNVLNKSHSKDYRSLYCAESVDLVRDIYRQDFERFGYRDNLPEEYPCG